MHTHTHIHTHTCTHKHTHTHTNTNTHTLTKHTQTDRQTHLLDGRFAELTMDRTNNLCEYLEGLYMGKGSLWKNGKAHGVTSE